MQTLDVPEHAKLPETEKLSWQPVGVVVQLSGARLSTLPSQSSSLPLQDSGTGFGPTHVALPSASHSVFPFAHSPFAPATLQAAPGEHDFLQTPLTQDPSQHSSETRHDSPETAQASQVPGANTPGGGGAGRRQTVPLQHSRLTMHTSPFGLQHRTTPSAAGAHFVPSQQGFCALHSSATCLQLKHVPSGAGGSVVRPVEHRCPAPQGQSASTAHVS